jgi:hypothetical protein
VDGERELQYLVARRIHSCFVGRMIWTITQDTPLRPSHCQLPAHVDLAEEAEQMKAPLEIKIFLSSPGDVADEVSRLAL